MCLNSECSTWMHLTLGNTESFLVHEKNLIYMERILWKADLTFSVLWKHPRFAFGSTWTHTFCFIERWINHKRSHFYEKGKNIQQGERNSVAGQRVVESTARHCLPMGWQQPLDVSSAFAGGNGWWDKKDRSKKAGPAGCMPWQRVAGHFPRWLLPLEGDDIVQPPRKKLPFPGETSTYQQGVKKVKGRCFKKSSFHYQKLTLDMWYRKEILWYCVRIHWYVLFHFHFHSTNKILNISL